MPLMVLQYPLEVSSPNTFAEQSRPLIIWRQADSAGSLPYSSRGHWASREDAFHLCTSHTCCLCPLFLLLCVKKPCFSFKIHSTVSLVEPSPVSLGNMLPLTHSPDLCRSFFYIICGLRSSRTGIMFNFSNFRLIEDRQNRCL